FIQGAAQVGARGLLIFFRPKQSSQGVTAVGLACHGQEGKHGECLTQIEVEPLPIAFQTWCTEQVEMEGHGAASLTDCGGIGCVTSILLKRGPDFKFENPCKGRTNKRACSRFSNAL